MLLKNIADFEKVFNVFAPLDVVPFEYSGIIESSKPKKGPIKKICLALDLTTAAVQEAIKQKSDLLIVFHAPDGLEMSISWHKRIKDLADNNLTLYKAHLRLNFCPGGVNDVFCQICNLTGQPLTFLYAGEHNLTGGVYEVQGSYTLSEILDKCKALQSPEIRVYNQKEAQYKYKKILVSSGSGFKNEFFEQFAPDMIISGEAKHGIVYAAKEYDTTLVEVTHWASEDRALKQIARTLTQHFGVPVSYISLPFDMQVHTQS